MKLIDADEAFRVLSDYYHHRTEEQHDALREALDRVPEVVVNKNEYIVREISYPNATIQKVIGKLVRCRDCRYGYQFYDVQKGITDSWVECRNPNGLNRDVPEDGYCYCGERKTDVD